MKKITSVLLMLSLILCVICASTVNVGAVSSRIQDGIEVMITTDKEEYSKNEDIQATVTIINNNSYRLTDVSIETLLPEGLELKTGSLYSKNIVVESGATYFEQVVLRVADSGSSIGTVVLIAAVVLLLAGGGPKDGRYVVWNPAYSIALTDSPVSDFYLQGEAIIRNGDAPTAYTEKSVWEVTFGPDNTLTLCRNGVALGVKPGYNGIGLGGEYTATVWEWEQTEDGLYLLRNADTDYYLEWYAAKRDWNIHNKVTDNNRKQFLLRLSPVK